MASQPHFRSTAISAGALDDIGGVGWQPLREVARRIGRLARVQRSRRALAELDDRMLADIGLSRAEADAERARPFWDLPPLH